MGTVGDNFLTWSGLTGNVFSTSSNHAMTDLEDGEGYRAKIRARYGSGGSGDWRGTVAITVAGTG